MLNAKLVVVGGDARSKEVDLRLPCIIGRGKEATLTLPHPLVSRQHTEITARDGRLYVKDLGSLNGTFLNNKRLEKEEELKPNQLLTLGNVTFRAVYEIECDTQAFDREVHEALTLQAASSENGVARRQSEHETVYDEDRKSNTSDTDKSVVDGESANSNDSLNESDDKKDSSPISNSSNLFVEIEGVEVVDPVSSIEGLPDAPSSMSFAGGVDLSGDTHPEVEPVDSPNLDFVSEEQQKPADGSGLDSFINKLPR